jgi:hypothetical protein
VLEPYRHAFDEEFKKEAGSENADVPPHRYLFHCYYYQYHLYRFATNLLDLVGLLPGPVISLSRVILIPNAAKGN